MKEDYLWDKTGEPDPETQQLEEILGTLRYEPRPLQIPAELQIARERSFFRRLAPRVAIAATIAMLLLGLGLWLGLQRLHPGQRPAIVKTEGSVKPNPATASSLDDNRSPLAISSPSLEPKRVDEPGIRRANRSLLVRNSNVPHNAAVKNSQRQEAAAAKDQLMLALRVAGAKLSLAQKKAQSTNPPDLIHNQHKIG